MWNNNAGDGYSGYWKNNQQPRYGPPPGESQSGYAPSYDAPGPGATYGSYAPSYAPPEGPPPGYGGGHQSQNWNQSNYASQDRPPHHSYQSNHGPPRPPPTGTQYYGPQIEDSNHNRAQPSFQYSQCNGKKKALSIGINYFGQDGQLGGCINDVKNITRFIQSQFGYRQEDIVILTDDVDDHRRKPTRENILRAMQWLVRDAQPNDSLFFHYSGHGGQTKDVDGDEEDGHDEVIYPVDFQENGQITDDEMHDIMVKPLPPGCRLTAIYDSCHSGSALDLPYIYSTEGKIKEPNLAADVGQGLLSAVSSYARGDMGGVLSSAMGMFQSVTKSTKADKISKATRTSPADVISWSGCKDNQTSADTQEAGEATGAMSFAFVSSLRENPEQSYQQLLNSVSFFVVSPIHQPIKALVEDLTKGNNMWNNNGYSNPPGAGYGPTSVPLRDASLSWLPPGRIVFACFGDIFKAVAAFVAAIPLHTVPTRDTRPLMVLLQGQRSVQPPWPQPNIPPSGYPPPNGPPPPPPRSARPDPYWNPSGYNPPSGPPPVRKDNYPGQAYHQSGGYPGQPTQPNYPNYPPPPGPPPRPPSGVQYYGPQGNNNQRSQPNFQYSQCNGKRKALCIGINYFGQDGELHGCINDVKNVTEFLIAQFHYKREDIVILTDDKTDPRQIPTRENMIRAMQWLVKDARPNDSLFFHYSGHGGQTKDLDGDEDDGFDEVIYPVDFEQNGHIVDDDMHDIMVKTLPPGCRLTAIYDSCHSGTALDLPYIYSTEGKIKEPNLAAEVGQGLLSAVGSYARGDMRGIFDSAVGVYKFATNSSKADKMTKSTKTSPADVIQWSGCKDSQTSADAQEAGQATGAMSYAFITALRENPQQSYQQLLVSIRYENALRPYPYRHLTVASSEIQGNSAFQVQSEAPVVEFASNGHDLIVHLLEDNIAALSLPKLPTSY
ncbi:hypothetical protein ONZ45_g1645 [Pleurotus djamor]|nr:hypothetical protein ONZ45_g1645 [Pleurotus djamor]